MDRLRSMSSPSARLVPSMVTCPWVAFFAYWGHHRLAELRADPELGVVGFDRYLHQGALAVALLLLYLPVPGLNGWFIPERFQFRNAVRWSRSASRIDAGPRQLLLAVYRARRHLGAQLGGRKSEDRCRSRVEGREPAHIAGSGIPDLYRVMLCMFLGTAIASSQYHALLGVAILFVAYIRKARLRGGDP